MPSSFTIAKENTIKAGQQFARAKQRELRGQGHKATGRLIKSIKPVVAFRFELPLRIDIMAEDYGQIIDKGLKRGTIVPVRALFAWVTRTDRGLTAKERVSKAFAVRQNIFKHGSPTPNAFSFSKNGRRTGWIDHDNQKLTKRVIRTLNMKKIVAERLRESFREQGIEVD